MSERSSSITGIVIAIFIALLTVALSEHAAAQTAPCPAGNQPATAADLPAMQAAGFPSPFVGECWNPNNPYVGDAAGDAKQFLQQHATKSANISCLNSQFASQLQKMIQAVPSNLGNVIIDSGYRSPQEQAALPSSATRVGACGSYHNYGLAADFNYSSKQVVQWIRANASQFGLAVIGNSTTGCFSSGFCDPAHVQEQGPLPSRDQCGICSSNGVGTLSVPANASPVSPENFYTPPAGGQVPAGYCLASTQPLIYVPCNSTGTVQPAPITQPQTIQPAPVTTPTVTPTSPLSAATTSNIFSTIPQPQQIPLLSGTTSATQALSIFTNLGSATSSSAFLNQSLSNIVTTIIPGNTSANTQIAASSSQAFSYPQDTFSAGTAQYFSTNTSQFTQVLNSLQNLLSNIFSYLQSL